MPEDGRKQAKYVLCIVEYDKYCCLTVVRTLLPWNIACTLYQDSGQRLNNIVTTCLFSESCATMHSACDGEVAHEVSKKTEFVPILT